MDDLAKRARENQGGSREIEEMLTLYAEAAQAFNRGRRLTASRAEGRLERDQAGPTFRASPSPPALKDGSVTMDTRRWEQQVENVVEQSAFGGNAKGRVTIADLIGFSGTESFYPRAQRVRDEHKLPS